MSQMNEEHNWSREFAGPSDITEMDRRDFIKYLGLFSSMSVLSNCSRKAEKIVPFVKELEEFVPGNYEFYSTAIASQGFGQGILVKSYQGRPIKIEGNPDHPASQGSTSLSAQACLYDLYHPDRLKQASWFGKKTSEEELSEKLINLKNGWKLGQGVAFVLPAIHSPTVNRLVLELQKKFPSAIWSSLSPWKREEFITYDLSRARTVVSFDEDLFCDRPDSLRLSGDFMQRRLRAMENNDPSLMNHLVTFQSSPTLSGSKSDELYLLPPEVIWNNACDLLTVLEGKKIPNQHMNQLAQRLRKEKDSLVIIGSSLGPMALELETRINQLLSTSLSGFRRFDLPFRTSGDQLKKIIQDNHVHTLLLVDSDLVYWDPTFRDLLKKVPHKIGVSLFETETIKICESTIPLAHFLEQWGDLIGPSGEISVQQPLIEPLYPCHSALTLLGLFNNQDKSAREEVMMTHGHPSEWEGSLSKGVIKAPTLPGEKKLSMTSISLQEVKKGWRLKVGPDPTVGYGEGANNPLLQEMPKHFSRLSWNNAFYLSEQDARELFVKNGDMIRIKTTGSVVEGPVWVSSLLPDRVIYTTLGYGQLAGTEIAKGRGHNAYVLPGRDVLSIERTGKRRELAFTQEEMSMGGEPPVGIIDFPFSSVVPKPANYKSAYPENPMPVQDEGPQWGMTIDLTTCIGCQVCVAACQVENNIPFVGEDQVKKKRILHWIRVDTYFENEKVLFQPVPCMHCEKAPCEVVCPVNATVHGNGGLNEMIYNRCVGTRYCSNNCPYKVRRFNFKAYSALKSPWHLGFNPEVSVRDRGVMEKCTYCIQRIQEGKDAPSSVQTACQQVCPTRAIEFSDLKDRNALVVRNKKSVRNYDLLEAEGTKPRTSYLKMIRKKNG